MDIAASCVARREGPLVSPGPRPVPQWRAPAMWSTVARRSSGWSVSGRAAGAARHARELPGHRTENRGACSTSRSWKPSPPGCGRALRPPSPGRDLSAADLLRERSRPRISRRTGTCGARGCSKRCRRPGRRAFRHTSSTRCGTSETFAEFAGPAGFQRGAHLFAAAWSCVGTTSIPGGRRCRRWMAAKAADRS